MGSRIPKMTGAKWEKLEKVTRQQCAGEGLAKKR